jgi:hypothetical protein
VLGFFVFVLFGLVSFESSGITFRVSLWGDGFGYFV